MALNPSKEQAQVFKEIILTLVSLLEQKDPFFKEHSKRVASSCVLFCQHLPIPKDIVDVVYLAGLLHDIGMVFIPEDIIHKSDNLSAEELSMVKEHPQAAEKLLSHLSALKYTLPIIRHHHERYDGHGYPDGLKGEDIPIGARILSIVDSYDAMTSVRPQRDALIKADALKEIRKSAGIAFDPKLVETFIQLISEKDNVPVEEEDAILKAVHGVVEDFKRGNIELPAFPGIVQQIRQTVASSNSAILDVAAIIQRDPVITLRLITIANSVRYGGGGKVQTVKQAVSRIGIRDTQDIISAIAMKSAYETNHADVRKIMEKLWQHAIATAYTARAIALTVREPESEMLFLLGLTHDIGKVLLLHSVTTILLKNSQNQQIDLDAILSSIQTVHAGLGGALLQRWGFADPIIQAVATHETPELTTQAPKLILILYLANMLSRRIGYSLFADQPADIGHVVLVLGLDVGKIDKIMEEVKQTILQTIDSV